MQRRTRIHHLTRIEAQTKVILLAWMPGHDSVSAHRPTKMHLPQESSRCQLTHMLQQIAEYTPQICQPCWFDFFEGEWAVHILDVICSVCAALVNTDTAHLGRRRYRHEWVDAKPSVEIMRWINETCMIHMIWEWQLGIRRWQSMSHNRRIFFAMGWQIQLQNVWLFSKWEVVLNNCACKSRIVINAGRCLICYQNPGWPTCYSFDHLVRPSPDFSRQAFAGQQCLKPFSCSALNLKTQPLDLRRYAIVFKCSIFKSADWLHMPFGDNCHSDPLATSENSGQEWGICQHEHMRFAAGWAAVARISKP